MKKKSRKRIVGIRREKPFPVVNSRFRLLGKERNETCSLETCQNQKNRLGRGKAFMLVQQCSAPPSAQGLQEFSAKESGELLWQKAYQEQKAGKEPDALAYPVCAQCCATLIMKFLGDGDELRASQALASAVTTGSDILLFDRNLSRDRTYPAVAVGKYDTLADFRHAYFASLEHGLPS